MSVKVSEQHFLDTVIEFAAIKRWLCHHDRPARTKNGWSTAIQGHAGFPDLVLAHPTAGVVVLELKAGVNKPTVEQREWLNTMSAAGVRCAVVWPKHVEAVLRLLARTKPGDVDVWDRFRHELAKDAELCFGPW